MNNMNTEKQNEDILVEQAMLKAKTQAEDGTVGRWLTRGVFVCRTDPALAATVSALVDLEVPEHFRQQALLTIIGHQNHRIDDLERQIHNAMNLIADLDLGEKS